MNTIRQVLQGMIGRAIDAVDPAYPRTFQLRIDGFVLATEASGLRLLTASQLIVCSEPDTDTTDKQFDALLHALRNVLPGRRVLALEHRADQLIIDLDADVQLVVVAAPPEDCAAAETEHVDDWQLLAPESLIVRGIPGGPVHLERSDVSLNVTQVPLDVSPGPIGRIVR